MIQERVNMEFETMFETGVDEMSWDDTVSNSFSPLISKWIRSVFSHSHNAIESVIIKLIFRAENVLKWLNATAIA